VRKRSVCARKALVAVPMAGILSLAAVATPFGANGVARAAASEQANCAAVLTSHFGPQGMVDDAVHFLQGVAAEQGTTLGDLAQTVAQTEGTLAQCLALLPQP
jgi:hypothetical protein